MEATAEGGIVGIAADVEIIGRVEFGGGGIVAGTDDAVADGYDMAVDVDEEHTGGGEVVTIEGVLSALCKA